MLLAQRLVLLDRLVQWQPWQECAELGLECFSSLQDRRESLVEQQLQAHLSRLQRLAFAWLVVLEAVVCLRLRLLVRLEADSPALAFGPPCLVAHRLAHQAQVPMEAMESRTTMASGSQRLVVEAPPVAERQAEADQEEQEPLAAAEVDLVAASQVRQLESLVAAALRFVSLLSGDQCNTFA